jgi:hypothetical protein
MYAGILGPLAFFTVIARGLLRAGDVQATLLTASISLFGFALLGYIAGQLAGWIVFDSVRAKVAAEITALQNEQAAAT